MNLLTSGRRAAAALVAICFALLLAGCVVTSKAPLVPAEEAVELLPASLTFVTYKDAEDGSFTKSDEQPATFTLSARTKTYVDAKGEMGIYFVPRTDGTYLLNVVNQKGEEGAIYGIARLKDDILELRVIYTGSPEDELKAAGVAAPAGATLAKDGITVDSRAALEAVIDLMAKGSISAQPLIAWVGAGEAPATIVKDGDWYKGG